MILPITIDKFIKLLINVSKYFVNCYYGYFSSNEINAWLMSFFVLKKQIQKQCENKIDLIKLLLDDYITDRWFKVICQR